MEHDSAQLSTFLHEKQRNADARLAELVTSYRDGRYPGLLCVAGQYDEDAGGQQRAASTRERQLALETLARHARAALEANGAGMDEVGEEITLNVMSDEERVAEAKRLAPQAGTWGTMMPEIIEQSPAVIAQRIINEAERIAIMNKYPDPRDPRRYAALKARAPRHHVSLPP